MTNTAGPGAPEQGVLEIFGSWGASAATAPSRVPLHEVTFVVVDLETTGGSPREAGITEIGAVKVRGGQILGEFQTLVDPGVPIPPFIALLTGITEGMLFGAPTIGTALPLFLDFARGAVLVAHNAPFDIGFLRVSCERAGHRWPAPPVVDTVRIARRAVGRDEVPNHKLSSLARLFRAGTVPDHRALSDARATVDVLHGLLARIGSVGVRTLDELLGYGAAVPEATRRKRHLADDLPSSPGVYLFRDDRGRVLYVGTSVDIHTRVRSYFTAAEKRTRMREMVALAAEVTPVVCATPLEARVRELRLIAEHTPTYNRRSRAPERAPWVKLTVEPFPRLAVVREVRDDGAVYIGPFGSTQQARLSIDAMHGAFALRQCTPRLPRIARADASACLLAELGRCGAPCVGRQGHAEYAEIVRAARHAMTADAAAVATATLERVTALSDQQRYEEAAELRDRMSSFVRGAARAQRLAPLAAIPELIAGRRAAVGGWEIVLVRHGRLAGTTVSPPAAHPQPYIEALIATGEVVTPPPPPLPAAFPEETEQVLSWLESPGVRLVHVDGVWASPARGAVSLRDRWTPHREVGDDV